MERSVRVTTPAAFILQKALSRTKRTDLLKREKDLCYIFYVMDAFRSWHRRIGEELHTLATTRRSSFQRALADLEAACETPYSFGVHALLHQRPGTPFSGLDDDQCRQHAWSVTHALLGMMRLGLSASE